MRPVAPGGDSRALPPGAGSTGRLPAIRPRRLRRRRRGSGAAFALPRLLALTLLAAACGEGDPEALKEFEEVSVGEATDVFFDTSFDEIGPRVVDGISGFLPAEFPRSVPLLTPGSLAEFGADRRARYVHLHYTYPTEEVSRRQLDLLRRAGWRVTGGGDAWTADRDGRRIRLELEDLVEVRQLRIEY